ncbi:MAG: DUF711 family protein [Bacteroidetes bacterium]|nr:DUF711 family protein [Bacteroidota bacterium]
MQLSHFCRQLGVRWFNICFDLCNCSEKNIRNLCYIGYETLRKCTNSFVNFIVAKDGEIFPLAALRVSGIISKISNLSSNGYDNFRAGVSLNPVQGTPFFPFSYAKQDKSFSIALETSQSAIISLKENPDSSLEQARELLKNVISAGVVSVDQIGKDFEAMHGVIYNGIDFSLAPFPDEKVSVIEIISLLGVETLGAPGSAFITSYLTDILKSILSEYSIRGVGFNGVMYSLLEDHLMCESNNRKLLSVDAIIGYSALCGCGLDMVPLPGAFLEEELASIILDVAAISSRLNKPLGVRVLPIPNREANEFTKFDSDFLTNTRVLPLKNHYCKTRVLEMNSINYTTEIG